MVDTKQLDYNKYNHGFFNPASFHKEEEQVKRAEQRKLRAHSRKIIPAADSPVKKGAAVSVQHIPYMVICRNPLGLKIHSVKRGNSKRIDALYDAQQQKNGSCHAADGGT